MFRTQKSEKPFEFLWIFSRGDPSSSSELLPVYEAKYKKLYKCNYKRYVSNKKNKENNIILRVTPI